MLDHHRVGHPGVGAADGLGDAGVLLRHAAHVRLVDDRLVVLLARRPVVSPVEVRVDDDRVHGVQPGVQALDAVLILAEAVRVQRLVAVGHALDGLGVGVEQQLARVAPQPPLGVVGAVHAEAVPLPGLDAGQVAVVDVPVGLRHLDPLALPSGVVQQAEFHLRRHLGEHREVGPAPVVGRTQRVRPARPHIHHCFVLCIVGHPRSDARPGLAFSTPAVQGAASAVTEGAVDDQSRLPCTQRERRQSSCARRVQTRAEERLGDRIGASRQDERGLAPQGRPLAGPGWPADTAPGSCRSSAAAVPSRSAVPATAMSSCRDAGTCATPPATRAGGALRTARRSSMGVGDDRARPSGAVRSKSARRGTGVDARGLEPPTSSVSGMRSNQLSYASVHERWRRDSNPCTRLCRPLPRLSATPPRAGTRESSGTVRDGFERMTGLEPATLTLAR